MCEANQSRTVASVPRSPTRSKGIHSPLLRGGDGGGAVYFGGWRTGRGGHRPTIVCLVHHINSSFFTRHLTTPRPTLREHLFNVVFFHKIHKLRNLNPQTTEFKSTNYGIQIHILRKSFVFDLAFSCFMCIFAAHYQ